MLKELEIRLNKAERGLVTRNTYYCSFVLHFFNVFYIGCTKRRAARGLSRTQIWQQGSEHKLPNDTTIQDSVHANPDTLKVMAIELIPKQVRGRVRLRCLLQRETFWVHTTKATFFPGYSEDIDVYLCF